MKKRILSLFLSLSMLLYFSSVAFAIDDTMATNTIKNQLNRDAVFALMQKHNITGGIDQETKNAFFSKLDKLNNLEKEKKLKKESSISIKINRHSPYLSITLHKCYPYYLFGISTFPNSAYHSIALRKFSITIV